MADDKDQKMWEDLFGADEGEEGDAGAVAGGSPDAGGKKAKKDKKEKKDKKDKKGKKDKDGEDENGTGGKAVAKAASPRKPRLKKPVPAVLEEPASQPVALLPLTDSQPVDSQPAAIEDKAEKRDKKDKKDKKDKADGKKDKKDKKEKKEKKRKGAPEEAPVEAPAVEPAVEAAAARPGRDLFEDFNADEEDPFGVGTDIWNDMDMADGVRSVRSNRTPDGSAAPMSALGIPGGSEVGSDGVLALPDPMPLAKSRKKGIEEEPDTIVGKLGKVLDTIKPRRGLTIAEKDAIPYIQDFVQQMIEAAELDEEEWRNGRPMIHKLQMLNKAVGVMEKYAFVDYFVAYSGVRALALWLKPLPNGEQPNVHIRTTLLNCMNRLPITKESLQQCKNPSLGMVIKNLKESKEETVANRKQASLLVHKWVGQVLTKKPELGLDQNEDDEDQRPRGLLPPKPVETYESFLELEAESFTRMHPTIPMPEGKELVIQPMPVHMPVKRDKVGTETNRGKLNEVMKVLTAPSKRAWKPYSVSIAGRQVNQV